MRIRVDVFGAEATTGTDKDKLLTSSKQHRFGRYGGRYVPPPLEKPLEQLSRSFKQVAQTADFRHELKKLLKDYAGRPTPLYHARSLSEAYGAEIFLKREDLLHGGAHKLNNTLGQALLAEKMGKERLIAETGAGQHGVATAMAGALLDLETEVYMGQKDVRRQKMNVFRMRLLGARVNEVTQGEAGLSDAIDVALEDFAHNTDNTHYLVGSVVGPDPYPRLVREFQSVIGREAREQIIEKSGKLPEAAVACVGGGSNAIGLFHAFKEQEVDFYGAEGGGQGVKSKKHAAPLAKGRDGVLHGMRTRLIDEDVTVHSVASGLDYPGVGPEHALLRQVGTCKYFGIPDEEALQAFRELSELEGIVPALESSHAVALAKKLAADYGGERMIINLSGRGDKDMATAATIFDLE